MYTFFDKHGKKLLAIASVLLILVFLLPPAMGPNFGGGVGGAGGTGTVNGEAIDPVEVQRAVAGYTELEQVFVPTNGPQGMSEYPLPFALFGTAAPQMLRDGGITWYLLVREAQNAGTFPADDVVDQVLANAYSREPNGKVYPFSSLPEIRKQTLREDVRIALAVRSNAMRSNRVVKLSQPLINEQLASFQEVRARLAIFKGSEFLNDVPAPSEEALRNQFESYASTAPGNPDANNPFGFGYRVPEKMRVQYVAVPDAEVAKAVEATRTPELWEEDARIYYLRNKEEFATPAESTGTDAASQPASQPVVPPFEQVADRVHQAIRKPLIEQRRQTILSRISQRLTEEFRKTNATTSPATQPAAASFEVLTKLRDEIQRQYGVTVTVVNQGAPMTQQELSLQTPLGGANYESPSGLTGAPAYLFQSIKPLQPADQQAAAPLSLYQPSPAMTSSRAETSYIVRVVEVQQARAPRTLEEVRSRVEADVRRKLAFDKAVEAAQAALASLKGAGLETLQGRPVHTSEWFGPPPAMMINMPLRLPIPGLPEEMNAFSGSLVTPVFDLLRGVSDKAELPRRDVIKAPSDDVVALTELFDVRTELTRETVPLAREQVEMQLISQFVPPTTEAQWYDAAVVHARVGYTPPEGSESPGDVTETP